MKYYFLYLIVGIDLINELIMRDTGPSSTWDDYKSKSRVKVSEHLKRNIPKKDWLKNKYCDKCNVSFATHHSLIRHYKRAHPDDQLPKIQIPKIQQEKENQNVTVDKIPKIQEENENSTEDEEEEEENPDEKDNQIAENQTDNEDFGGDDEEYVVEKVLGKRLGKKGTIGNLFPKNVTRLLPSLLENFWVYYTKKASTGSYNDQNINLHFSF